MRKGPFLRTVIVTCDMKPPVKMNSVQTIVQKKKLPVPSTQYPELLILLGTGYWVLLPPPVHRFPPQRLRPLIKGCFCPFAMRPPGFAKLRGITSSGRAELVLRQTMAKDHQGAARVI